MGKNKYIILSALAIAAIILGLIVTRNTTPKEEKSAPVPTPTDTSMSTSEEMEITEGTADELLQNDLDALESDIVTVSDDADLEDIDLGGELDAMSGDADFINQY